MHGVTDFSPSTNCGHWLYRLAQSFDVELATHDIAETNLRCAVGLSGTDDVLLDACLRRVDDWTELVDRHTRRCFPIFRNVRGWFDNSESRFRCGSVGSEDGRFEWHWGGEYRK